MFAPRRGTKVTVPDVAAADGLTVTVRGVSMLQRPGKIARGRLTPRR